MSQNEIQVNKAENQVIVQESSGFWMFWVAKAAITVMLIVTFWGFIGGVFVSLTKLAFLLILAIFFAYLLKPLVNLIEKPFKERHLEKFMPRPLSIGASYVLVFAVLWFAVSSLAPKIADQAKQLASNVPVYTSAIQNWVKGVNSRFQTYQISEPIQKDINDKIGAYLASFGEALTGFIGSLILNVVSYLPWLILIPVIAFFFLKDVNLFKVSLLRLFPSGHWRGRADSFLRDVNFTLAAYTRAQLISCLLIGTVCVIGFALIGVNYALLLGILAGVLEFIPLIGPLTVAIIAVTIAAFYSPSQAITVAVFLGVLRIIHDYVTYPRIVREGIHLHPLAIILSVLAGEQIAGITGVFLSIPAVALLSVLIKHIREHRGSKGIVADILSSASADKETEIIIKPD